MSDRGPPRETRRIVDIADARIALSGHRLAWLGQRASDAIPVARIAPPELLVTCEGGPDVEHLAGAWGARLVTLEQTTATRSVWSNASVDLLARLDLPLPPPSARAGAADRLALLAYCATPAWERRVAAAGTRLSLLAPPAALKRRLDDKAFVRRALRELGLPAVPCEVRTASDLSFADLARRYAVPFIIQLPIGASGVGTFEVRDREELASIAQSAGGDQPWLISRCMGPASLNVNAVALPDRAIVSAPSVQIVGVPPLADGPTIYCGNDFGAAQQHPAAVLAAACAQTRWIGRWLSSLGFSGVYGVDYAIADDLPYPLEINPRFQGSTGLLGQLELQADFIPLGVLHCLHWLGYRFAESRPERRESLQITAAQAIFHLNAGQPKTLTPTLRPGIYSLDENGALRFRRAGIEVDGRRRGEVLVTGMPAARTVAAPGATILRLAASETLATPDGRSLMPWGRAVCSALAQAVAAWATPELAVEGERLGNASGTVPTATT